MALGGDPPHPRSNVEAATLASKGHATVPDGVAQTPTLDRGCGGAGGAGVLPPSHVIAPLAGDLARSSAIVKFLIRGVVVRPK